MRVSRPAWIIGAVIGLASGYLIAFRMAPISETVPPDEGNPRELYAVVQDQLAALQAKNFPAAYAFAASGIREKFPVEQFEKMVRATYPQLTRQGRLNFGVTEFVPGNRASLLIFLQTAQGSTGAIYTFVKEGQTWKIEGVELIRGGTPIPPAADLQS